MEREERCEKCHYFDDTVGDLVDLRLGQCHRFPGTNLMTGDGRCIATPLLKERSDWCGEYVNRQEAYEKKEIARLTKENLGAEN